MYLAELHGKFHPTEERKEDILTSNVFSFFKYAKREVFLYTLLSLLDINIDKSEAVDAEFVFWPNFEDGTEPDLVIIAGKYYLLFEAKLHSGFGKGVDLDKYQILREIKGGELEAHNIGKEFRFIAVTAHYAKHRFLEENAFINNFDYQWINWHQIALLIFNALNKIKFLDKETISFSEDLYALLIKMNLRKFAGIEVLTSLINLQPTPIYLFFDPTTSEHRGDFIGFMNSVSKFLKVIPITDSIFFRKTPSLFGSIENEGSLREFHTIFFKR